MSDVISPIAPAPIPTPPDFPVTWQDPQDQGFFWMKDRLFFPGQAMPMSASLLDSLGGGWIAGMQAYDMSFEVRALVINTYLYTGFVPPAESPEELAARAKRSQGKLEAAIPRLNERWKTEWLPEAREHLAYWKGFDLRGASTQDLLAHLEDSLARFSRLMEIHALFHFPGALAISQFEELYRDLFGNEDTLDACRLLQGLENTSLENDRAVWELSRKARAVPRARAILQEYPAAEAVAALERLEAGRAFLEDLRLYLEKHGWRARGLDVARPALIEDSTLVIQALKGYLAQEDRDPLAVMAGLAAEREQLIGQARARLAGYPQQVVDRFELLLKAVQAP